MRCRDAVERLDWAKDRGALRVIFVCGNESARQDPEVKLEPLAQAAIRKNIIINTIFCGNANAQKASNNASHSGRRISMNCGNGETLSNRPTAKVSQTIQPLRE